MKKTILGIFILLLGIFTVACGQSNLENYKDAVIKTDSITKGTETMEVNIFTNYKTEGLNEEDIRLIKSFEKVGFTLKSSFDNKADKYMASGYMNFANLGYDFKAYGINGKKYIEPYFLNLKDKKYIEIKEGEFSPQTDISVDLFEEIGAKWNELINEDNVIKGENVLVSTDDGEVKSKEFTIDLRDEQMREFLLYIVESFEKKDEYMQVFQQVTYLSDGENMTEKEKEEVYEELFVELKEFIEETENLNLFYKAYIDIDGYIVQEDIRFSFENEAIESGELKNFEFSMTNKISNIEKDQDFNFIEPREEESISIDEIDFEAIMNPQGEGK